MTLIASVQQRLDNWKSALTGLGTVRDKFESYFFERANQLDSSTLEEMYHSDDMAAKLCDKPAKHMLRRGWDYKGLPDEVVAYLNKEMQRLGVAEKLFEAMVWESLFGGSAIFIGADDGRPIDSHLDLVSLKRIAFVAVAENRELTPHKWYSSLTDDKYGHVAVWCLTQMWMGQRPKESKVLPEELAKLKREQVKYLHESRMVVFPGALVTKRERIRNNGWGGSVVSKSSRALKTFQVNWSAVSHIMQDASQGVFKMKDLHKIISLKGGKEKLQTRMELLDMSRSVSRALLVDSESEEFDRKEASMSGLADLLDRTGQRLAAAADMPVTVMMGISPAGLNATGQSDIRNWYDQLEADRKAKLSPRIKYLSDVILQQEGSPVKGQQLEYEVVYEPLWQLTQEEEAGVRSTNAQTDTTYISAGVLTPEQVARKRWTKDGYQYAINEVEVEGQETTKLYDLLKQQLRSTDQPEAPITEEKKTNDPSKP